MNVKINDNVLVITGKYAGKTGKVKSTSPKNGTVIVEGVNIHRKAKKARKTNEVSQFVEIEAPIDASNVMVLCPSCGKAVRVKMDITGPKKVRVCGKCGAVLDRTADAKAAKKAAKKAEPKKRIRKRDRKAEKEQQAE